MWRASLLSLTLVVHLLGAHVEPGEDYEILEGRALSLIAPKGSHQEARSVASREEAILHRYAESYGYRLDSRLYLGIASSKNQIANAFSTQIPLNMQIDYPGGALAPDYFATTSWMQTLLLHESAHNFQLNAKRNLLSCIAHRIVGNTPVTWAWFAPIFPLPNLTESSFILEGNAVLNESLCGNGGRLYSGAFRAMTLLQAKAGYITPARVYNDHLYFPYGTHHYIVGGFFQLFLARRYGLEKTNRYFLAYSDQWLPFFTNAVYRRHFGQSFETLLDDYNEWLLEEAKDFRQSRGEVVAYSQRYVPLNSDANEVAFLTSDARYAPRLVRIGKKEGRVTIRRTHHLFGKLFRLGGKYYSLASGRTANNQVMAALYDSEGVPLEHTEGKALQCLLPSEKRLYFDIATSTESPHLYLDGVSQGYVNSSVVCDKMGNYYYFRQDGAERMLYRGQKRLLSFEGYYGRVADIDSAGRVLFVANSAKGSTLYRAEGAGEVSRLTEGDDILDARLLDDDTAIVEVITADGISFMKIPLHAKRACVGKQEVLPQQSKLPVHADTVSSAATPRIYRPVHNLHYSALEQFLSLQDDGNADFSLEARFSDPLERNHLRLFLSSIDQLARVGIGYDNSAHVVTFGADIYATRSDDANLSNRGFGLNGYIRYPFYRQTYRSGDLQIDGHLDNDRDARSQLSLTLSLEDRKKFGIGFYPNALKQLTLFTSADRGDFACGTSFHAGHDLGKGFYMMAGLKYARSDTSRAGEAQRGIWIDESTIAGFEDPSRFVLPSLPYDLYSKEAFSGEVTVARMFSFGRYYFSLPLALRQESLYARYRYLHLENRHAIQIREVSLGIRAELLVLHKIPLPVTIEWMHNDDIEKSRNFRFMIDLRF